MKQIIRSCTFAVFIFSASHAVLAQNSSFSNQLPIDGYSQPARLAKVAAATTGIVDELVCHEGDDIQAGECIGRLDSTIHAELVALAKVSQESKGELESAQAQLRASQTRLARIFELAERQHATNVELLQAEEQVAVAKANLLISQEKQLQRQAEYKKLVAESEFYCVRAPFNGVVVEYLKEKGEYVGATDPHLCVLAQLDELSVDFLVPRPRRGEVTLHGTAQVLFVDTNQTTTGRIVYVSPYPNGETNLYTVKVRVANANRAYEAGMRCHLLNVVLNGSIAKADR